MTSDTSLREKALRATKLHFRLNALIRDAFFHGRVRGNLAQLSEADHAAWMDYDVSEYEQYKSVVAAFTEIEATLLRIEALEAERDELIKALKPFAEEAGRYDPVEDDDHHSAWCIPAGFRLGQLRAARALLLKLQDHPHE